MLDYIDQRMAEMTTPSRGVAWSCPVWRPANVVNQNLLHHDDRM